MKKKYLELKDLLKEKHPYCEVCDKNLMTDVGHALYHVHGKNVAERKIYDSYENCQSNCNICNTGYGQNANSRSSKKKHWAVRCEELGEKHMLEWNFQIPKWRRDGFE